MRKYRTLLMRTGVLLLGMLCWVLGSVAQNGFSWTSVKPEKATRSAKVMVLGRRLTYYPIEKGEEIEITLEGPTTLRVLTRIEFGPDPAGEKQYYLRYKRDDGEKGKFQHTTTASATAVLAANENLHLGTSRNDYVKVPSGKHTYRFFLGSKAKYRLYLRFYKRTTDVASKARKVAFAPARFTQAVALIVHEEEITYYRVGDLDSLQLSVIGPTTVQVNSRLEFDPSMIATQKFRIRIFEDGREKQTFSLRSEPSQVAEYRDLSNKVVGKAAKFFIEVPRGKHEYRFAVLDRDRSVLLRFFIPQKDLSNNL